MILLGPQVTKQRIRTLLEDNNLDLWNLNCAVSIVIDLVFAI